MSAQNTPSGYDETWRDAPAGGSVAPDAVPASAAIGSKSIGLCNNQKIYDLALCGNKLFQGFVLKNCDVDPFLSAAAAETLEHVYIAFLISTARCALANEREDKTAITCCIGEVFAPCLPDSFFLDKAGAGRTLVDVVTYILKGSTCTLSKGFETWNEAVAANGVLSAEAAMLPPTVPGDVTNLTAAAAMKVLVYLASKPTDILIIKPLTLITYLAVSYAKHGTISREFCNKLSKGLEDDVGRTFDLESDVVRMIYSTYGQYINDLNIQAELDRWSGLMPANSLRLKLTLSQASGSGMTAYTLIGQAVCLHPNFNWPVVYKLFPDEFCNFRAATVSVAGNLWYGYRHDLGPAKSTKFQNLTYVAKELLSRVDGKSTLASYKGFMQRCANYQLVTDLIVDYINKRGSKLQPSAADVGTMKDILLAVEVQRAYFTR